MQFLPCEFLGGPWDGQIAELDADHLSLIPGAVLTYSVFTGEFAHFYQSAEPWDLESPLLTLRHVAVKQAVELDS